ncbi:MAG: hypothetical protein A2W26_11760 [Acidobacteria bacterium RBG_16_64_8]|nr:MAG: hypothetical protein A2W26_11760 [Acidobacteria bacterium RBG_16_64_8]
MRIHAHRFLIPAGVVLAGLTVALTAAAYPPGVGILAKNRSCASCHVSNGPWGDEARTIIDVLDEKTKQSLRGPDGAITIAVPRGASRTVLTVLGRAAGDKTPPRRNAWLYVDPSQIETSALSKFAPGWDVNLPMSCRIVGDRLEGYEGVYLTVLPMTVRPSDAARDAELELQVMLTAGKAVKGKAQEGLISNFFVRKVLLKVLEP